MNTKLIGVIIGVVVVVAGGYMLSRGGGAMEDSGSVSTGEAGSFRGSLADLSARGGNWKCTVSASANTGAGTAQTNGTVYVSGARVRMDASSEVPSLGVVQSHMIADGEYVYSWTSAYPQGVKARMTATTGGTVAPSGEGFDANQSYSYDCVPEAADASLFVVPGDVRFMSL